MDCYQKIDDMEKFVVVTVHMCFRSSSQSNFLHCRSIITAVPIREWLVLFFAKEKEAREIFVTKLEEVKK